MICRPKDQGGLGIEVLEMKNKCLLSKWLFKLLTEEGTWQELLHNKYVKDKMLAQIQVKPTDSPFWKGLMHVKDEFLKRGSFRVGSGSLVRFWEDVWLGETALAHQYPSLYNIVMHKNVSVHSVLSSRPLNIGFRRTLDGSKWDEWMPLCNRLILVQLNDEPDRFAWKLTKSGIFTVKSMYEDLMNYHEHLPTKYLWKLKVPLKIKIFMWFLRRNVLLTRDNLIKRQWKGSKKCCFCDAEESIEHLFLSCPLSKIVWRIVFSTYNIPPPTNIKNMFGNWLNGIGFMLGDLEKSK
jgi:hypothetical protein